MHIFPTVAVLASLQALATAQGDYVFWWQPGAAITRLTSTMLVPAVPPINTGFHALWPGLQPNSDNFVFQNVIDDDQPDGKWAFSTWYGPYDSAGDFYDYGTVSVQPGDAITTIFDLYSPTGEWIDNWILEPGTAGAAAGETPSSGGITNTFAFTGTLTQALFVIELQGSGSTWNFGSLTFTNIIITANTTSTSWCSNPSISSPGTFSHTITTPVATVNGAQCDCYIEKLVFVAPTGAINGPLEEATTTALHGPISSP